MRDPSSTDLVATRLAWHTIAEHVLSALQHADDGHIGLRRTAGGVGTRPLAASGGRRVTIAGGDLLILRDGPAEAADAERREPITTVRAAGAFAGIEPGAPADVYTPSTSLDLDRLLTVDLASAARLGRFYADVEAALIELRGDDVRFAAEAIQIWPEHFDQAVTLDRVNYGGSPGDDGHAEPYLYIGPYEPPAMDAAAGGFWNEPFGASLPAPADLTVAEMVAFFRAGRERLAA
jgi:hypothetical protein